MIRSWADDEAEKLFTRQRSRKLPSDLQRVALRKLLMLDAATTLEDLRVPPANRLEKLKGDREGQWSIASTTSGGYVSLGATATRMT